MIEHSTLLRLAKEYAARKAQSRRSLVAALLTGSVARGEPPLGDAVDLDIILVDDGAPDPNTELVRLSDYVFVDAVYVRPDEYADRKALRAHHFTGPALNDALLLHDPRHYFDILQAAIRASHNRPDQIYARARSALAAAGSRFDRLSPFRDDPVPEPLPFDLLCDFHECLYLAATALLLLSGQPGDSSGGRKLMVRFEAAARRFRPELYPLFLAALGAQNTSVEMIGASLADWLVLYKAASQRRPTDATVHPLKRGYYERGFRALIAEGHALNTLWLLERTLAACVSDLDSLPEAWLKFLGATGKRTGAEFSERIRRVESLLALMDETLIRWAKNEAIEW